MTDSDSSMLAVVDRLGKLEGMLLGLQSSINQGQASTTAFMARVERLEQRQVELERNMVTSGDIASLSAKVDRLVASDARQQGGTAVASWSLSALAPWAAVVIALLALVGVGVNREQIQQQAQPEHRA